MIICLYRTLESSKHDCLVSQRRNEYQENRGFLLSLKLEGIFHKSEDDGMAISSPVEYANWF